ncbi:unnamed protein product [Mesocestoides corti]|uniref:Insulin-induced gene 1 protein n=1 Tax=Mesocestoides corti TaxID=53468 RepID=A0A3P6I7P0_MESCO|nr:unnamed protein product [Mesocestoides corti]
MAFPCAAVFLQVIHTVKSYNFLVVCGLASPLLYPNLRVPNAYEAEWTSIMRCVLFFVGISHATAKLNFVSNSQLLFTSLSFAIGIWWLFDRSAAGAAIGVLISLLGTTSCFLLGDQIIINSVDPLLSLWFPCIFFSGGITASLVGRQLAKSDVLDSFKIKAE